MFLNIDKRNLMDIIAVDSSDKTLSVQELFIEREKLKNIVEERAIVFLLCNNTIGSLMFYINLLLLDVVPLLLNSKIDENLFEDFYRLYTPQYVIYPVNMELRISQKGEIIYLGYDYIILKTQNKRYPIHKEVQLLMTTSGSTGSPKLVKYKKGNLDANAKNVAAAFRWTADERPLCDLAMNYTMGLNVINTHIYVGATVYLTNENIMSAAYWDFIKKYKLTNMTEVPFGYELMIKLRFTKMDLPYMKTLSQGGGKLSDNTFRMLAEYAHNNGKRFIASFGTTETSARLAMLPPEFALDKIGSIGKAIPGGELFLLNEKGEEIFDPSIEGELVYSGPNVTMGYAISKKDLQTGDEFQGVFKTGDLAKRDEDGFYYITGRKARFVKLLGYRFSLDQCERLIKDQFNIECACIGEDDKVMIFVIDEKMISKILDYITNTTGFYKSLFNIKAVAEIPKTDSGKIKYQQLENMR